MINEFRGEYSFLSNFTKVDIVLDGIIYPSVEHAYCSAKNEELWWKAYCADEKNQAGMVKKKSRYVGNVSNWKEIQIDIMTKCLKQKFSKEPFHSLLMKTGDMYIQEGNNWNDKFWGVCLKTGVGENNLGKILMQIRDEY